MKIIIDRPIVFFDLETTGVSVTKDRIVQIGAIKIYPDGTREVKNRLVNPTIPIPIESSAVHGITDEDVKDEPSFRQVARGFYEWLNGCDLAGYNSDNFDIPMLSEEFSRVGFEYPTDDTSFIDVIKIERIVNSHKLGDTYKRYTGMPLENAHDAIADIEATIAIFEHQIDLDENFQLSVKEIEARCKGDTKRVDFAGKLYEENGKIYWSFGKHKGKLVSETKDYAEWVIGQDFPYNTKMHLKRIIEKS
jgi:DNA polymerase-3 subunit epsilon